MATANPRLLVGHTGITWRDDVIEDGIKCIAALGYNTIEIFAWTLKALKEAGRGDLFQKYNIPLISSYYSLDIVDPNVRDAEMEKLEGWTDVVVSLGGKYATFGGNAVPRRTFKFDEHKKYIVDFVNEAGKRLQAKGMKLNFHPHTGTPVETAAEIRPFLDAIDTKVVGFAPDIGQIQKGGADPLAITKDYISILGLVHFKDYSGSVKFDDEGREIDTSGFTCYAPLGKGVVDLEGYLDYIEGTSFNGPGMVELDGGRDMPMSAEEAVTINRDYMAKLGYKFVKR
jgi:inosose dehydratase